MPTIEQWQDALPIREKIEDLLDEIWETNRTEPISSYELCSKCSKIRRLTERLENILQ
jgi:hypothetical protein